jgi:glycosyltransferase involved in cell wall biosynthesis
MESASIAQSDVKISATSAVKLLILSNNLNRASFRQRIEIYLEILRGNGIDCEVSALPAGWFTRGKICKLVEGFDGVFLHKKTLNFIDAGRLRKFASKIIYDFDDAVMFDNKHPEVTHHKRQNAFNRTARLADLVIAGNPYLAEHAKFLNPNVEILPTGLNTNFTISETRFQNDGNIRLVWIGSKATLRYLEEIFPALEKVCSHFDNVILRVISDKFPHSADMRIEKRPWSLNTEIADLAGCDIGLAPLPDNRFTRGKCGFKILQYACASLPVVASPVGINKDYIRDGITGFLAEDHEQWIEKITALINNPQLRRTMGQQGRQFARQFDVSIIGKRLCEVIRSCILDDKEKT